MKNWNWKQWTVLGIVVAVVIAAVVCHLVQPEVSYAWLEVVAGGTFVLGGVGGYLLGKSNIVNSEKQLLKD